MIDTNLIIANNIINILKSTGKKQTDLADAMGISRQIVSKMLMGARSINAIELKRIAEFCDVTMEVLMRVPKIIEDTNIAHVFMGKVKTDSAKQSIKYADEIIDLFVFHDSILNAVSDRMSMRSSLI